MDIYGEGHNDIGGVEEYAPLSASGSTYLSIR